MCALLAVGVYFGLYFLLKPVRRIAGIAVEDLPGGEEMQALLEEARQDLDRIRQAEARIDDPAVRRDAQALRETGERILAYLHKNPEKIRSAHQFLTYTLDTGRASSWRATSSSAPPGLRPRRSRRSSSARQSPCPCSTRPLSGSSRA